ncbi:hypothetical protein LCGC14_0400820 [marine sediment metagenome]|uniref:Helix-turn-helix domain-containing protein n=1 Tax=marine sediment metagenome TaxID=412755 RepID=A0A0F9T2D8_9ZZZZ
MSENDMLEQLIDAGLAEAEIVSGHSPDQVSEDYGRAVVTSNSRPPSQRPPPWAPWEDEFVQANLGLMSLDAIGRRLGRSGNAIKIHYTREGWPPPFRRPGWLTGNRVATLMCVDVHAVSRWVKEGWIPHRRTPNMRRDILIDRRELYRWAINPRNWLYFQPERVRDPRLRRLLELKKERWGDEWWTTRQVAEYHDVDHTDVNRLIHLGKIQAVKWGNQYVVRSEAMKAGLWFIKGKGTGSGQDWSEEGDAFLLLARAVGLQYEPIAAMMGGRDSVKRLQYRMKCLESAGEIPWLIGKFGLEIEYDPQAGTLHADWRAYPEQFPQLFRTMSRMEGAG